MRKFCKLLSGLIIASLISCSVAYACNETFCNEGIYLGLGGGLGKVPKVKSNQDFPLILKSPGYFATPIDSMTLSFKNSRNLNASLGYRFGNFRIEINPIFLKAKYKEFHQTPYEIIAKENLSGNIQLMAGLVNGYCNLTLTEHVWPYVGLGLGYAKIKNTFEHSEQISVVNGSITNLPTLKFSMNDKSLVYQAIVGSMFKVSDNIGLTLDYRYLSTAKKIKAFNERIGNHSVNLGVMYAF